MRHSLMIAMIVAVAGGDAALAQSAAPVAPKPPVHHARARLHGLHQSVPTGATGGRPGTANSATPDANVPPIQTPQAPVRR
jgi:hypothetical protein